MDIKCKISLNTYKYFILLMIIEINYIYLQPNMNIIVKTKQ